MADFQTVGVTSAFSASRSNQHRFHRHHHHHRHQPQDQGSSAAASPSPGARLENASRTASPTALAFLSQSSKKPFPVSGADFRVAETTTTSGRRGSEDPSSHLRSEWVTLSKAMLMMLVEKICQLTFENEPAAPPAAAAAAPPGTGSGRRGAPPKVPPGAPPGAPPGVPSSKDDDAGTVDRCRNSHVDRETASLPPSAIRDPFPGRIASAEESEVDSQLTSLAPSPTFPSSESLRGRPRTSRRRPSSECSPNSVEPSGEGLDGPATSPFSDDSTRQEAPADASEQVSFFARKTELVSNSSLKRNSKHNRRKLLLMAGKAGKSGRPGFGGGEGGGGGGGGGDGKRDSAGDDTFRKLKMRSLHQRNSDRNVQSWIACNKSLVYSMIDSALGMTDPQQQTTSAAAVNQSKTGGFVTESAAGNGADDGVTEVTASSTDGGKTQQHHHHHHQQQQQQPVAAQEEPICRLKPACEAPLLGALLNHDDAEDGGGGAKTTPPPPPCFRFGRWPKLRPDARNAAVTATAAAAAARGQGATCSSSSCSSADPSFGLSTQNAPRLYEQSPTDGLLLLRRVAGAGDRCDMGGSSVETPPGGSRRSAAVDAVGQTSPPGSDGDDDSVFVDRERGGAEVPAPRRRRFGSESGTRRPRGPQPAGDVAPTAPRKPGPLWIALDKSEVCSLVDSLVSRMMTSSTTTNGDVGGQTSARCRGDALPSSAAVSRGSADGGNHDNDDDDDVPVDFSRARSAGVCIGEHHGNDDAERGDHGNGRQRKYSIECLLFEDREKSEDLGSECSKETDNNVTSRRQDGSAGVIEGSKFNLKWKSNMLLRLHSQSQEDCDNNA